MKSIRRGLRRSLVVIGALLVVAGPAGADIAIEFDELIWGPEGSLTTVAEVEVPAEFVGDTCVLAVIAENQASVHPGNDLVVSTGDSQAVIVGVEDEVNGGTSQEYAMVVGSSIVVQLRFGPDGISSLGFGLTFDCARTVATEVPDPDLDTQLAQQQAPTTTTTTAPPPPASTLPPPPAVITNTTTSVVVQPADVAGATTNELPQSEAAAPVVAAPAYTG